jgi:thiosulfate dehydrogenase [quinone] large subunit
MRINNKSLAYALLRIAFGVNFAGHGIIRLYNGVGAFAHTTQEHLTKSPLPPGLTLGFSYAIPFIEAVLGLTLVLGVFTRISLVSGAVFMMALTLGVTANQQWDVASPAWSFFYSSSSSTRTPSHSTTPCTGRFQVEFNSRVQ